MEKPLTKRQQQAARTKKRIAMSALQLMEENGFENVTIQDICKEAEVSVGNFYHYFTSKDDVLLQTYVYFDDLVEQEFTQKTFDHTVDAILDLVMGQLAVTERGVDFQAHSLVAQLQAKDGYFFDENRYFIRYLRKLVEQAIEKGEIHPSHGGEAVTQLLLQTSRGLLFDWAIHKGGYSIEERATEIFTLLFFALKAPKGS